MVRTRVGGFWLAVVAAIAIGLPSTEAAEILVKCDEGEDLVRAIRSAKTRRKAPPQPAAEQDGRLVVTIRGICELAGALRVTSREFNGITLRGETQSGALLRQSAAIPQGDALLEFQHLDSVELQGLMVEALPGTSAGISIAGVFQARLARVTVVPDAAAGILANHVRNLEISESWIEGELDGISSISSTMGVVDSTLAGALNPLLGIASRIEIVNTELITTQQAVRLISSVMNAHNITARNLNSWAFLSQGSQLFLNCSPRCALDGLAQANGKSHFEVSGLDSTGGVHLEGFSTGVFRGSVFRFPAICETGSDEIGVPSTTCPSSPAP